MRIALYRGSWYAVWREGGETHRRALRTKDRDAAARALADYQRALAAPDDTAGSIYAAYLAEKGTERAKWAWGRLKSAFGHLRPDQIDGAACRAYAATRRHAGAGDGTVHTELTFLRAALRWHNKATPAVVILPSKPPPMEHHLDRAQYSALLTAATTPHVHLFVVLALTTAGRMGAILELTWDRVDFERGVIRLGAGERRQKGRASVPMTDRAKAALTKAAKARTSNYVIEYAGGRVGKIRKSFAAAAESAGIPWCTPHVLRHTAAVWMAEAGVPMPEIAQYLGHTDDRITQRVYARFSPQHLRRAAGALE